MQSARANSSELPVDARDVSNYILDVADRISISVSNLSLQKILFFCHGNFLTHYDKPLFHNPIEAWKFGPVVRSVYDSFRSFGAEPITARALHSDALEGRVFVEPFLPDDSTKEFLDKVILSYAQMSPSSMVYLSHAHGGPWAAALASHRDAANVGLRIDDQLIKERFNAIDRAIHRI